MKKRKKKEKYKVYVCGTDARYHIPLDYAGVNVYFAVKDLKEHEPCWKECGIVRFELDCSNPRTILKENWELTLKNAVSIDQIAWRSMTRDVAKHLKEAAKALYWGIKYFLIDWPKSRFYRLKYRLEKKYGKTGGRD